MSVEIEASLTRHFGFQHFLKGQERVIRTIIAGASAAAIFPTGAGKSLCYQLPALHLPGLTLVVSPLLSLMKDQIDFLRSKNIAAVKLDSGMTREAYQGALAAARDGRVKILMIAVERFKNERFRLQLEKMQISLLAVDEAHCISEWGHNFRPDYLKIPAYRKAFNIPQVLLLTATATPKVARDMGEKFGIGPEHIITTGFYRKNLQLEVAPVAPDKKDAALVQAMNQPPAGPAIVYVIQQKTAETVARMLCAQGFDAAAYHAGMKSETREKMQNRFMTGRTGIVVATIAFGMGIDKADIRKVVHYDLPKSMEGYSQEIGRAGRDGRLSVCRVLGDRSSVPILENFVYGDTPEKTGLGRLLEKVLAAPDGILEIRLLDLSKETDIRILPLKTALVYLELEGIIQPKYVYFEDYPFKQIASPPEIAARFSGERKAFVETVLAHTNTARVWSRPDMDAIVRATGSPRHRVVAALDYFDQQGWIELAPRSSVEVFAVTGPDFDLDETCQRLFRRFASRETFEIERIGKMAGFFQEPACLAAGLSGYFGEKLAGPCGTCSWCREKTPARLPEVPLPELTGFDFHGLTKPLFEKIDPPVTKALLTRFLCGINTPRLSKIRAGAMANFGRLAPYPYQKVLAWVEAHQQPQQGR